MSISGEKADPDGNVLWYWYENYHRSSKEETKSSVRVRIRRFERYLAVKGGYEHDCYWTDIEPEQVPADEMVKPRNVDQKIAFEFISDYLTEDYGAETQKQTSSTLSSAYEWLANRSEPVDADPIAYVLDDHDLLDDSEGRNPYMIDIEEARRIINSWENPRWLTVNLMFPKTLRRKGAILNLDLEDVNIDHPGCDWEVHPELRHWDDHILFQAEKKKSDPGRNAGNKTVTTRKCPLDDELKNALIWYLTIRRGSLDPSEPLFKGMKGGRLSPSTVNHKFKDKAQAMGHFYEPNDDDNINPHYWRHWSTTWFEDRLGEDTSLTDYFRGDKGSSIKTRYNQWSEEKKQIYLEHVPKFFTGDQ